MAGGDYLPQRIVPDIELAGMVVNKVASEFHMILHYTKTAKVLLQKGCLNQGGVTHNLPYLGSLKDAVIRGLYITPLPSIFKFLRFSNFAPTTCANAELLIK